LGPIASSVANINFLCRGRSAVRSRRFVFPTLGRPSGRALALAALLLGGPALAPAMEIAADYHVPFTPENAILGYFSPTKTPVLTVPSGAIVSIDGGGGIRYGRPSAPAAAPAAPGAAATPPTPPGPGATPSAETIDAWLKENNIPVTVETCPALAETLKVMKETPRPKEVPGGPFSTSRRGFRTARWEVRPVAAPCATSLPGPSRMSCTWT
jgi:hypothetical protein